VRSNRTTSTNLFKLLEKNSKRSNTRVIESVIEIRPAAPAEAFNEALRQRLRIGTGMTQVQMAQALGIHWQTYQKFEYRSPLPPHLIPALGVRG
jgi:hypothetical protein